MFWKELWKTVYSHQIYIKPQIFKTFVTHQFVDNMIQKQKSRFCQVHPSPIQPLIMVTLSLLQDYNDCFHKAKQASQSNLLEVLQNISNRRRTEYIFSLSRFTYNSNAVNPPQSSQLQNIQIITSASSKWNKLPDCVTLDL